jgi:hypothetical protein
MYTFQPLAPINSINDHSGFVLVGLFMLFVFIIILFNNDDEYNMYKVFVLCCIPVGLAGAVSWNTGTYSEYRNERVTATLVGFQPEGYNVEERSGKTTRRVDKHFNYVVYEVNGSRLIFRATEGIEYPKTAILYKN